MSVPLTVRDQINALSNQVLNLKALIQGSFPQYNLYAMLGNQVIFGCKVTEGYSATDMILALEEDSTDINPDKSLPPARVEQYPNIANVYGRAFLSTGVNVSTLEDSTLELTDAPATVGYGRYDVVYIYVNSVGPGVGVLTGTASEACKTAYDADGLDENSYPSTYDPSGLPAGCVVVARVYVQYGDTGIADSRIVDLRSFDTRLGINYWMGTQGDYDALGSYDSDRMYFISDPTEFNLQEITASTASTSINRDNGELAIVTLEANTAITITGSRDVANLLVHYVQGTGGAKEVTHPGTTIKWAGGLELDLSSTEGAEDVFHYWTTDNWETVYVSCAGADYREVS